MIRFDRVSLTYPDAAGPTLRDVDLRIPEGELCLVTGRTGAGKSTLLGAINGLVPHFSGGHLEGAVTVDGHRTQDHPPRELAEIVGVVGQDPLAGFVTDTVEEELAYGMEQLGLAPSVMRTRVEETLDLLGIAELRSRSLRSLSGGQQQRVAIGAVLTAHPRVLVLDEPTSALDPTAAEEVLAAITRLVHDLGVTAVVAEHRLERVVQYADRIVHLVGDGSARDGDPVEMMATSPVAPPVVRLGRLVGWRPLPLSVRDARRQAGELRDRLGPAVPAPHEPNDAVADSEGAADADERLVAAQGLVVAYGSTVAVSGVDLELQAGRIVGLMGRNGSGKSSLMWALQGTGARHGGHVRVREPGGEPQDPARLSSHAARRIVGLVPQTASDLLYLPSVGHECSQADADARCAPGSCRALLERMVPGVDPDAHPRDLSEGQRLSLVLAIQLTAAPSVVLLDEPTRGLDQGAKEALAQVLREQAAAGRAVMVSSHDVEFVASVADRVVVMAQGEVVADASTAEVLAASPAFAPQVAKILAPQPWLTVEQVADALARLDATGAAQ